MKLLFFMNDISQTQKSNIDACIVDMDPPILVETSSHSEDR